MKLTFEIDGSRQTIIRTDGNEPASESLNYLEAEFNCTGMSGMIITPEFIRYSKSYFPEEVNQETIDGKEVVTCLVRPEVIKPGGFYVIVTGYEPLEQIRVPVGTIKISVTKSGYKVDCEQPKRSIYEQILKTTKETKNIAQSVRDDADAGEFDGLTTSITVNGETYVQKDGNIDLGEIEGGSGSGENGATYTPSGTVEDSTLTVSWTNDKGLDNPTPVSITAPKGEEGDAGIGIESIKKTSTSGLIDTYTITFLDGRTSTFTVTNGEKGDAFTYSDFTDAQLAALKGEQGDAFVYSDFTDEQLALLKGEKGDAFTYDDFTDEQLDSLKGERGTSLVTQSLTQEEYDALSTEAQENGTLYIIGEV